MTRAKPGIPNRKPSAGVILICVLAAMVVVTTIAGVTVRSTLRARQMCKTERDLIQLELLIDAGMQRAQQRLAQDANYAGEDWLELEGPVPGSLMHVDIKVLPEGNSSLTASELKTIQVHARIDGRTHDPLTIQCTRSRVLELP